MESNTDPSRTLMPYNLTEKKYRLVFNDVLIRLLISLLLKVAN